MIIFLLTAWESIKTRWAYISYLFHLTLYPFTYLFYIPNTRTTWLEGGEETNTLYYWVGNRHILLDALSFLFLYTHLFYYYYDWATFIWKKKRKNRDCVITRYGCGGGVGDMLCVLLWKEKNHFYNNAMFIFILPLVQFSLKMFLSLKSTLWLEEDIIKTFFLKMCLAGQCAALLWLVSLLGNNMRNKRVTLLSYECGYLTDDDDEFVDYDYYYKDAL